LESVAEGQAITPDLSGADLSGKDLSRADLRGVNFSESSLSRATVREADLQGAVLRGADLRGVNFSESNLTGASQREANLQGVDLSVAKRGLQTEHLRKRAQAFPGGSGRMPLLMANRCHDHRRQSDHQSRVFAAADHPNQHSYCGVVPITIFFSGAATCRDRAGQVQRFMLRFS
jgi:Pentapeptide repeats (8 copies)